MDLKNQRLYYKKDKPKGEDFFKWINSKNDVKESITLDILRNDNEFNSLDTYNSLSEFLDYLYKVSTCEFGCKQGNHIIEFITGKGYNLGIASIKLIGLGFYDEAISMIRSTSEIVNLFSLFAVDKDSFKEWFELEDRQRMFKFSPKAVRNKITALNLPPIVSDEYYWKMCEVGVHVNPKTKPQGNNLHQLAIVGGIVLENQAKSTLNDLAYNIGWLSVLALKLTLKHSEFKRELDLIKPSIDKIGNMNLLTIEKYIEEKNGS